MPWFRSSGSRVISPATSFSPSAAGRLLARLPVPGTTLKSSCAKLPGLRFPPATNAPGLSRSLYSVALRVRRLLPSFIGFIASRIRFSTSVPFGHFSLPRRRHILSPFGSRMFQAGESFFSRRSSSAHPSPSRPGNSTKLCGSIPKTVRQRTAQIRERFSSSPPVRKLVRFLSRPGGKARNRRPTKWNSEESATGHQHSSRVSHHSTSSLGSRMAVRPVCFALGHLDLPVSAHSVARRLDIRDHS